METIAIVFMTIFLILLLSSLSFFLYKALSSKETNIEEKDVEERNFGELTANDNDNTKSVKIVD